MVAHTGIHKPRAVLAERLLAQRRSKALCSSDRSIQGAATLRSGQMATRRPQSPWVWANPVKAGCGLALQITEADPAPWPRWLAIPYPARQPKSSASPGLKLDLKFYLSQTRHTVGSKGRLLKASSTQAKVFQPEPGRAVPFWSPSASGVSPDVFGGR